MKKSFIFMLALCSGLAFADAPQVANSIDKTAESVAPAFTKDVYKRQAVMVVALA